MAMAFRANALHSKRKRENAGAEFTRIRTHQPIYIHAKCRDNHSHFDWLGRLPQCAVLSTIAPSVRCSMEYCLSPHIIAVVEALVVDADIFDVRAKCAPLRCQLLVACLVFHSFSLSWFSSSLRAQNVITHSSVNARSIFFVAVFFFPLFFFLFISAYVLSFSTCAVWFVIVVVYESILTYGMRVWLTVQPLCVRRKVDWTWEHSFRTAQCDRMASEVYKWLAGSSVWVCVCVCVRWTRTAAQSDRYTHAFVAPIQSPPTSDKKNAEKERSPSEQEDDQRT